MKNNSIIKRSIAAFIISLVPLLTLIPVILKISLPDFVNTGWAILNICCVMVATVLSLLCVTKKESRNIFSIIAILITGFWILMISGIILLAFIMNIMK